MFGACHRWHHQMCKLFSVVEILLTFKSSCIKCILLRIECLCFEQRLRLSASTKSGRKSKFIQLFFLFCKFFHQYTTKTISRTFTKNQEIVNSKWFFYQWCLLDGMCKQYLPVHFSQALHKIICHMINFIAVMH